MQTMASEKPHLGRSRIHGELLKLGFSISERTVSRYLSRSHRNGKVDQRWRTFLKNHREAIAGMDFFTVITANFRILYCLFLIRHSRREIIHFNSTEHPTSEWVVPQLRDAFPESTEDQYLIFDRDAKFGAEVLRFSGLLRNFSLADELPEPLAKRSRRTLGSKHPQRTTRPCDRAQRTPPASLGARLPPLLSWGSYSRWTK